MKIMSQIVTKLLTDELKDLLDWLFKNILEDTDIFHSQDKNMCEQTSAGVVE